MLEIIREKPGKPGWVEANFLIIDETTTKAIKAKVLDEIVGLEGRVTITADEIEAWFTIVTGRPSFLRKTSGFTQSDRTSVLFQAFRDVVRGIRAGSFNDRFFQFEDLIAAAINRAYSARMRQRELRRKEKRLAHKGGLPIDLNTTSILEEYITYSPQSVWPFRGSWVDRIWKAINKRMGDYRKRRQDPDKPYCDRGPNEVDDVLGQVLVALSEAVKTGRFRGKTKEEVISYIYEIIRNKIADHIGGWLKKEKRARRWWSWGGLQAGDAGNAAVGDDEGDNFRDDWYENLQFNFNPTVYTSDIIPGLQFWDCKKYGQRIEEKFTKRMLREKVYRDTKYDPALSYKENFLALPAIKQYSGVLAMKYREGWYVEDLVNFWPGHNANKIRSMVEHGREAFGKEARKLGFLQKEIKGSRFPNPGIKYLTQESSMRFLTVKRGAKQMRGGAKVLPGNGYHVGRYFGGESDPSRVYFRHIERLNRVRKYTDAFFQRYRNCVKCGERDFTDSMYMVYGKPYCYDCWIRLKYGWKLRSNYFSIKNINFFSHPSLL